MNLNRDFRTGKKFLFKNVQKKIRDLIRLYSNHYVMY